MQFGHVFLLTCLSFPVPGSRESTTPMTSKPPTPKPNRFAGFTELAMHTSNGAGYTKDYTWPLNHAYHAYHARYPGLDEKMETSFSQAEQRKKPLRSWLAVPQQAPTSIQDVRCCSRGTACKAQCLNHVHVESSLGTGLGLFSHGTTIHAHTQATGESLWPTSLRVWLCFPESPMGD